MSTAFIALLTTLALIVSGMLAPTTHAQEYVELTPELDARAAALYAGIMCPICNGQTISQSHAQIAQTMREMVRERLVAGDTDAAIYDFMISAFGEDIIASPPTSGLGLAVWVVPPIAILLGAIAVAMVVRKLRVQPAMAIAGHQQPTAAIEAEDGLETYLDLVDREMGESSPGEKR